MIKVENLKKTYDKRTLHKNTVLRGMSFTLPDTGFVCILGPSGCGKTTLLNAIGGLDAFDSGTITADGTEIKRSGSHVMEEVRNSSFGYIFQNYYLLSEHSSAYNVYIGMHSMPLTKKEKTERVRDALQRVDMLRYIKRNVGNLSGGQQQRIAIARAIARKPKVIFADEPTGNLDEANTMNICTILKELSRESLVLMVTHEERVAKFFADRIITLEDGEIVSDSTAWTKGTMDAGERDAIYSDEYTEQSLESEGVSLRILRKADADTASLSVVIENDRIVIKTDDPRVILSSQANVSPRIIDGARPILTSESFDSPKEEIKDKDAIAEEKTTRKNKKKGLGLGFTVREALSLVSGKKLRKFSTGLFIILLSLMVSLTVSDFVTLSNINPENFISTDSHILELSFDRGPELDRKEWDLSSYKNAYIEHLLASDVDFDLIPKASAVLKYADNTIPQLGDVDASLGTYNYVNISRLDKSTLIAGRMPERYDEIVIDRWVIDKMLDEDGIVQNIISNSKFLIGKKLILDRKSYSPTVVGICDSGEPAVYLSTEGLLSSGANGTEVITLSEFRKITGYDKNISLDRDECIVLPDTAGEYYKTQVGAIYSPSSGYIFTIRDAVSGTLESISAKFVISDDAVNDLFGTMISSSATFSIWCEDKAAMQEYIDNEKLPSSIEGKLDIEVKDRYKVAYEKYKEKSQAKVDARMILTVTILMLSVVMLYLMQRSKIKERMDLVSVYRLLGIPKGNLMFIFALESLILTLKYAIPTVFATWLGIKILTLVKLLRNAMLFPLSAVGITLAAILVIRLLIAVLPVLRLLSQPPARLAAKHDF